MDQIEVVMSSANQITIPKQIRQALNLTAGDKLTFKFNGKIISVTKAETQEEKVRRVFRELDRLKVEREKHMTPEQKAFAQKTAGWTVNQFHEYFDNLPETKAYIKEKYGL